MPRMVLKEIRGRWPGARAGGRGRWPGPGPGPGPGPAYVAAAALVYFATMRLTRGMAASVCFLAIGRILS